MNDKHGFKSEPLVSYVIPAFNHEYFVADAIISIINQTYKNIELIVIDDGSTDCTLDIIKSLEEKCQKRFVRFLALSQDNQGLSATLNQAIEWSQGEYFAALASDDWIKPHKVIDQVSFLENNPDYSAVFSNVGEMNKAGDFVSIANLEERDYLFEDILFQRHYLPALTQLIRMSSLRKTGYYDSQQKIEDWSMWLKLSKNGGRIRRLNKIHGFYRKHSGNTSSNLGLMHVERIKVLRDYKDSWLYRRALAECYRRSGDELRKVKKIGFIGMYLSAFLIYPKISARALVKIPLFKNGLDKK